MRSTTHTRVNTENLVRMKVITKKMGIPLVNAVDEALTQWIANHVTSNIRTKEPVAANDIKIEKSTAPIRSFSIKNEELPKSISQNNVETVYYHQLAPWQRYYYKIAYHGGEETYCARLKPKKIQSD